MLTVRPFRGIILPMLTPDVTNTIDPGTPVQVAITWAGCAPGYGVPSTSWFPGYTFVRIEGSDGIVTKDEGLFAGIEIRCPLVKIRTEGRPYESC